MHKSPVYWKHLAFALLLLSGPAAFAAISSANVFRVAGDGGSGGDVGQFSSLAEDAGGGQHIAYYDATFQQLKLAQRPSTSSPWTVDTVTTSLGALGQYCSIAIGAAQNVSAAADFTAGSSTVIIRTGLAASNMLVGGTLTAGSAYTIAAVDALSATKTLTLASPFAGATATNVGITVSFYQPAISFQGAGTTRRLMVARPRGDGGWTIDTVDGPGFGFGSNFTGFESSLAISGDGRIHVAYRDGATTGVSTQSFHLSHNTTSTQTASNVLRYAVYEGGAWKVRTADPAASHGFGPRIVVDNNNAPIIFSRDNIGRTLLATWKDAATSATWHQAVVDSRADAGLAIGATYFAAGDEVLAAFHEQSVTSGTASNNLMFTAGVRNGSAWSFSLHQMAVGKGIGDFAGVAHGTTTGTLSLTFYDSVSKTIKRMAAGSALAPTSGTQARTLDAAADVGQYTSPLADPSTGTVYSAYYDATRRALKIASDDGSTTAAAFVDGLRFGTDSAIGLTSTHVVVAYYAQTEGTLHLARWLRGDNPKGPSFVDVVLDASSADVGESVHLAVDVNDTIYLDYIDRTHKALRGAMVFSNWAQQTGTIVGPLDSIVVGDYCDISLNHTNPESRVAVVFQAVSTPDTSQLYPTIYYGFAGPLPATDPGSYTLAFSIGAAVNPKANLGRYCTSVYDSSGTLHVAYLDDNALAPAYATVGPGGVVTDSQVISGSLFDHGGLEISIAINPVSGAPGVAYYDISNASLKYAELLGTDWGIAATVDGTGGDTGHTPVLRFDKTGQLARIAYYNKSTGQLRLATHTLGTVTIADPNWELETLLGGTMGVHPSLWIDTDGSLSLSFEQATTGDLLTTVGAVIRFLSAADPIWMAVP